MATLEARIIGLAQAIGLDVKTLTNAVGNLASLTTTDKTSLVAAINELKTGLSTIDLTALIDDAATTGDTDVTYSADKIISLLDALKSDILGGIPTEALDTIKELADFLTDNTVANGLIEQLSQRVRVDAVQTFDATQQAQGRSNIGAAAAADLTSLSNAIGDTDHDFTVEYAAAKV